MNASAVDGSSAQETSRTEEQQQALDRLFARIGEVSSLPAAAVRIIHIANDESSGASDLITAVESDPSLAVRVLRTVNSTFYSLRNRVGDLKTAVSLLGMKEVRNLALTVHVSRMFAASGDYRTYRREGLWQHMVAVASTSRLIAEVSRAVARDEAYVAGLLHDVGLILLDQHLRRQFKNILDGLERFPSTIAAERSVLPFDHCELGQSIARHWNLSESVSAAAGFHHEPERYEGPHGKMVALVCLANYLCTRNDYSSLGVNNVTPPGDDVYRELDIHAEDMTRIAARLNETLAAASTAASI